MTSQKRREKPKEFRSLDEPLASSNIHAKYNFDTLGVRGYLHSLKADSRSQRI